MSLQTSIKKTDDKNEHYVINGKYDIQDGQYGVWEMKKDSMFFVPKGSAVFVRKIITRIQVLKQDAKALIASIFNQEPESPCILQHEKLGFTEYDEHTVFLGNRAVGAKSKYCGKLQIGKKGKYQTWKKLVEEEVLGNTPLEFILAVAGSGILVDYLREKVQVENIIVSLVGESSSGKTSAGLLMVSCGAKPSSQGDSLVLNFSDTQNALLATIPSSYPVLIDEGSLCNYNPTKLLYSLSMGKEKKRLTKDLEKAETGCFSTAIAITSEKSMIGIADENTGLLVRVLEIENEVWTKSAESADRIKNTVSNNYGWLIPKLAEYILDLEQDDVVSLYRQWYEYLVESAKEQNFYNNFTERACKQYALILMSASFIMSVMDIELNTDEIIHFIETHSPVREANCADIGARALIYLMQYVTKYYSQFVREEDEDYVPKDCLGRIKEFKRNGAVYKKWLLITDTTLEKILKEGRFPEKIVVLKKWKEQGILNCEKDRYLSDIVIAEDMKVKGYKINLPIDFMEDNQEQNLF